MNNNRNYFTFFKSFREQIDLCEGEDQLKLYKAITDFALYHIDTSFTEPLLKMAWLGIKPHLEKSWTNSNNGKHAKGVSKPKMRDNRNAAKDEKQSEIKAKTKRSEGEKPTIGMECNGMDCIEDNDKSSSSCMIEINDDDDIWKRVAEAWLQNSWRKKPRSPLHDLRYGIVTKSQKDVIKQRLHDCIEEYGCDLRSAWDKFFTVITYASEEEKNGLHNLNAKINFKWLIESKKNFLDVLNCNYLQK